MKKAIIAGLLLALSGFAMGQVDPNRTVATVNGTEIKGAEYYRRMEFLPGVGRDIGSGFAEFPPGFLTLEQLITEKLVFQLAKKKGVSPTDPEVQAELDRRRKMNPKMMEQWAQLGRSEDELRYNIRFELAQFKILTAGVTVTDQEVDQHYKQNPAEFTSPKQATLRVIVVRNPADATKVDQALASGKAFADVAKQYSADITAASGGEYGTVPFTFLNEQVRNAVIATKVGSATAWFPSADKSAQFKFLVEAIIPEKLQPMTDEVRFATRQRMMMDKGKIKNDIKKELGELRKTAAVDIKEPAFADAYKKYVDASIKTGGN